MPWGGLAWSADGGDDDGRRGKCLFRPQIAGGRSHMAIRPDPSVRRRPRLTATDSALFHHLTNTTHSPPVYNYPLILSCPSSVRKKPPPKSIGGHDPESIRPPRRSRPLPVLLAPTHVPLFHSQTSQVPLAMRFRARSEPAFHRSVARGKPLGYV